MQEHILERIEGSQVWQCIQATMTDLSGQGQILERIATLSTHLVNNTRKEESESIERAISAHVQEHCETPRESDELYTERRLLTS